MKKETSQNNKGEIAYLINGIRQMDIKEIIILK